MLAANVGIMRRLSAKYRDEPYRVWEKREYDATIGRIGSSQAVATYKARTPAPSLTSVS
jgi:hypothetical protein